MSRKSKKRHLDYIGENTYDFDFELERAIYCYVCHTHISLKQKKKLKKNEQYKFELYKQWKDYICNKYEQYSLEILHEFSRYLNQRYRNIQPESEYWKLIVPVVMTLATTKEFEYLVDIKYPDLLSATIVSVIIFPFIMITIIFFIWNTIKPIWQSSMQQNLLLDYKEIIEEIIEIRKENLEEHSHCYDRDLK